MGAHERDEAQSGQQVQESRQSTQQGKRKKQSERPAADDQPSRAGIGSSQGQDRASRETGGRPSAGTPDIERGGGSQDIERGGGSEESLVQESTGAFKERP